MYFISAIVLSILLLNTIQAQSYDCSCSCCLGQGCQTTSSTYTTAPQCTDASCLQACKARYYQCTASPPNGQAIGRCTTPTTTTTTYAPATGGPYSCQCNCCNTGSYSCALLLVGYTNAFSCQVGACSIACSNRYPYICVNNQYGQTQGTCVGLSSPAPTVPNGSFRCGCSCQMQSGYHSYEVIPTNGCPSCPSECQSVLFQCQNRQNTYCVN